MTQLSLKIYNPCWHVDVATDWNIQAESADLKTVLQQPYKIAALPVMWNQPDNFVYSADLPTISMEQFDLVMLSDIESHAPGDIYEWLSISCPDNYVTAMGAKSNIQPINPDTMVYRPWWMYNLMRLNQYQDTATDNKHYLFDVLLGTRRPHRDFVMLNMQKHSRMLENSIVNYRDVFTGSVVDEQNTAIADLFKDRLLQWPYVSSNLDPAWEVSDKIEKNISPFVPYEIYRRTWYTVVCETAYTSTQFFLTEKTSKPLFAKRLFVMFSSARHLENLRLLGFETFGNVIDESYDLEEIDERRYQMAFDQLLSLSQQDPSTVLSKVAEVLEHNHNRMWQLQKETRQHMQKLIIDRVPTQYVTPTDVL